MIRTLLLLLAFAPTLLFAQPIKQMPSPEWLLGLARVGEYQVSPDGKQVVYAVSRVSIPDNKSEKDLYLAPTTGPVSSKVFVSEKGAESAPQWKPDGKRIGYLADKDGITQVWEANLDGTNKVCLTTAPRDVEGFKYVPNDGGIVYISRVKLDSTVTERYKDVPKSQARVIEGLLYRHWNHWSDYSYSHVFYQANGKPPIDLMRNQLVDCPVPPMGGMEDVVVAPDGLFVLYVSRKERGAMKALSTNSDIYRADLKTAITRNITEGNLGYDRNPAFSPDGKMLAYSSMEAPGNEAAKARLMVLDLTTGDKKDLTASFDEGIAGTPVWEPTGKGVYVPVHQKGTEQILYFSVDSKQAPTVVSAGRQNLGEVQLAVGGTLVCPRTAMDAPTDLILLNPKTKKQTFITEANKEMLANTMLPQVESKMVKTTDGKEMLVWHILPPNFDKAKRYPTLLYCQGGPQSPVSQAFSYRWNFMVMASQGYVVVAPCRRGMPGFGRKWNDDISGDWGGQPMRDYLSAIDDASALPYVDRDKLGCVGASYGGYSTFFLAGMHEKRFKAFISHCGVFNLESMAGTTEELFFNNYEFGGPYWNKPQPKSYTEFSPHKFVDKWDTPMLVIHGGLDFRVPEEQGMQAYTALQERGIPSKFVYFPDEGHWVMKPQNSLVWHREFYGWLGKYLK